MFLEGGGAGKGRGGKEALNKNLLLTEKGHFGEQVANIGDEKEEEKV